MALDPSVVGTETKAYELSFDWRTVVLYALGIGARRDELDYLYEARGPKVFPTFAVVPAYAPMMDLLARSGGDVTTMVHGAQTVRLLRPIPSSGVFSTVARIDGVYDMRRLGQVIASTRSEIDGQCVCETEWSLLFRGEGGFGGRPPPKHPVPRAADGQAPDWLEQQATLAEQALLYRLSGDENPLHADPEFAQRVGFERGPILHGLATFGFIARAIVRHACNGDALRLHSLSAQFKKPVWPGETIRSAGYRVGNQVVVKVSAAERDEAIVSNCYAEIGP
jgi:acyl dehydratase